MEKSISWSHPLHESYDSINPVWQNILKKKTPTVWNICRKNHWKSCFRDNVDFVQVFTLSMLVHLVGEKLGRPKSRRKVIGLCQRILHFLSHGCFMKFRPEIVEIVGDSYDSKRSQLKSVAFKSTFENTGRGSSTFWHRFGSQSVTYFHTPR